MASQEKRSHFVFQMEKIYIKELLYNWYAKQQMLMQTELGNSRNIPHFSINFLQQHTKYDIYRFHSLKWSFGLEGIFQHDPA